jgi:putative SOS response-associated peptidase YedK
MGSRSRSRVLWESFPWPDETVLRTFTIMATMPNAEMSELHDRIGLGAGQWKERFTNR